MIGEHILEKAIRIEGIQDLIRSLIIPHRKRLPSTNQWYRLRQIALTGNGAEIRQFLEERKTRKKVRKNWNFTIDNTPFYQKLIDTFVNPIETAGRPDDMPRQVPFRLSIELSPIYQADNFKEIKRLVTKKALCKFIEQTLLFQEGLTYTEVLEGMNRRMEVNFDG